MCFVDGFSVKTDKLDITSSTQSEGYSKISNILITFEDPKLNLPWLILIDCYRVK